MNFRRFIRILLSKLLLLSLIPINDALASETCKDLVNIYAGFDGKPSQNIVKVLNSPSQNQYGSDNAAITPLTLPIINWGAQCRDGNTKKCEDVIELLYKWSSADSLKLNDATNVNDKFAYNSTIRGPMHSYIFVKNSKFIINSEKASSIEKWFENRTLLAKYSEVDRWANPENVSHNHLSSSWSVQALLAVIQKDKKTLELLNTRLHKVLYHIRNDGSFVHESQRGTLALFYTSKNIGYIFGWLNTMEYYYKEIVGKDFILDEKATKKFHNSVEYLIDNIINITGERHILRYSINNQYVPGFQKDKIDLLFIMKQMNWTIDYIQKYKNEELENKIRNIKVPEFNKSIYDLIRYKQYLSRNLGYQTGCRIFIQ